MTINLNDSCTVTLSQSGVDAIRRYYSEIKCDDILHRQYPDLAAGMILKTQLWDLFQMFGSCISLGAMSPFQGDIEVIKA